MSADVIAAGILAGGLYALIGLGVSLVFGVLGLMNLAHGELVLGGSYIAWVVVGSLGVDPLIALPIAMAVMALIGYPLQRFLLTGLLRSGAAAPLVATFGLSLIAQALLQLVFGIHPKTLAAPYGDAGVTVFGIRMQGVYLITAAVTVVLFAGTAWTLSRTRAGSAIRASAADPRTAGLLGLDVERIYALTFAWAAALAAAAGVMTGVAESFTPSSGTPVLLVGFAVMALGGIGSVAGTLLGGITLGLLQSVSVAAFGGGWRNFVVYLAFFLALAFRPAGLFRFGAVK